MKLRQKRKFSNRTKALTLSLVTVSSIVAAGAAVYHKAAKFRADPYSELSQSILSNIKEYHTGMVHRASSSIPEIDPLAPGRSTTFRLKSAQSIDEALTKEGIREDDCKRVVTALSLLNERAAAGSAAELIKGNNGTIVGLRLQRPDGVVISLSRSKDGEFSSAISHNDGNQKLQRVVSGTIIKSFRQAALDNKVPMSLIDDFVDLFSDKIDFRRQLQPGDTFSLLVEQRQREGGRAENTILAASITANAKPFFAVRHVGGDGKARYFDESGKSNEGTFLRYPLQFTRVSSVFADTRMHPVLQRHRPHNGVDFAAPIGTPVRSVGAGVVTQSGYHREMGYFVTVKHDQRYTTQYLHLSKIDPLVSAGSHVEAGQQIGKVGMSGLATGPHLHFSLYDNGRFVDPMQGAFTYTARSERVPTPFLTAALDALKRGREEVQVAFVRKTTGATSRRIG